MITHEGNLTPVWVGVQEAWAGDDGVNKGRQHLGSFTRQYWSGIFYLSDSKYSLKPEKGTGVDVNRAGILLKI